MGEAAVDVTPTPRDLQSVLLEGKTRTPEHRAGSVSRRPIIDRARRSGASVVTVTAPAGYGKSTMLTEWAGLESRQVGWVSLDRTDDDPAALLSVIGTASIGFSPATESIVQDMRSGGATTLDRAAPLLAAALSSAPSAFVLFIDDLHWADSDDCQDAIEVLLAAIPSESQIVFASRRDHRWLAGLRATGAVLEIGPDDLRLDHAAARSIFEQVGAATVADSDLDTIVDRCEGWPTGLYLSALVSRSGGDATALTGHDRYLADYLYSECIRRLPEETQTFLRRSAVLDEFSAAACNAVLETSTSQAELQELEAANLFLIPLDRDRTWYRYHALFREFLLAELERVEGAESSAQLHRRAAAWHQSNGAPARAVDHLLLAGDLQEAGVLVARIAPSLYQRGQIATIRRWLSQLGDTVLQGNWPLIVSMMWLAILFGEVAVGTRWAPFLRAVDPATLDEGERVYFTSNRAMIRASLVEHGHLQALDDATYAYENEPADSGWRSQAIYLWASACLLTGDVETARKGFEDSIATAERIGNYDNVIVSGPELALLAIEAGRWDTAARYSAWGIERIASTHTEGYPTTALALAVAARLAFREGDRRRGDQFLARGMRARAGCTYLFPGYSIRSRLELAKAHVAIGDRSAAWHLVREIDELLRQRGDVGALATQVEEFRASLALEPVSTGSVPLTPAELRLLPYLQTHLTIAEIGQRLFVSRNTVSSQVGSIYRKLSVTTRAAAVERATEIGLLGR
ncbi:AAA family ATPase [Humibacter soli]